MQLIGLIRLGQDAEVRYTADGQPVATLSGAWDYGRKDAEGKRPTQWSKLSLWGDRADKLSAYLLKGTTLYVIASDVHLESWETRDGKAGTTLVGRVDTIEFAGRPPEQQAARSAPREHGANEQRQQRAAAPAPRQQRQAAAPKPATGSGFDDMDDDIPF